MDPVSLYSYVEDPPSAVVARRIVEFVNVNHGLNYFFPDGFPENKHGFGNIKRIIPSLIQMAGQGIPAFVMADLDNNECAPTLIREWLAQKNSKQLNIPNALIFRIAVREIESWILADRANFAKFLGINAQNISSNPDELPNPKQHILNIIQKKGTKKWHRQMLPQSPTASIGPIYNEKMCEFLSNRWDIKRAASASPSLARTIDAFRKRDL